MSFDFRVEYFAPGEYDGDDSPEGWIVSLPHQCERWQITGDKYETPPPHVRAVTDLERFITEATEALQALKTRHPTI